MLSKPYRVLTKFKHFICTGTTAFETLHILFRLNGSEADIDSMVTDLSSGQHGADGETTNSMGIFQFLRQSNLRLALFVCLSLHLSQQLSGMVAIFYYSTSFFQSAGLDESTRYNTPQLSKAKSKPNPNYAPKLFA